MTVSLNLPKLEGNATAFQIANAVLDVDVVRPGRTLKATLRGPVEGRLGADTLKPAQVSVSPLGVQAALSGPQVPNQSVTGSLEGSAAVDFLQQQARAELAGVFDQSTIKAKLGVAGFSPPGYTFDVDIDRLDLTRYQAPPTAAAAPVPGAKPAAEAPIDLSALRDLNANGSIRIGALTAPRLKASNVRIEVKAEDGRVDVDPLAANLYGGSLNGAIGVNARGTPQFTVKQTLTGVSVGPLLVDLAKFERLEGHGSFSMDVSTAGETMSQLKKGLNGSAAANLSDGAIKGINIAAAIREAKAAIRELKGKPVTEVADGTQKTDFTELKATFAIRHGIASNRDLTGKSPVLRLAGEGDIDFGNDRMNYLLKANLVESITVQRGKELLQIADITVPVRVTGPLNAPSYSFDFATMATDLAEQALQQELQRKLGRKLPEGLPADILQDAVKGLFKK
jgi:AsmA protein